MGLFDPNWHNQLPPHLKPDSARARALEALRNEFDLSHDTFSDMVADSPGTVRLLVERRFSTLTSSRSTDDVYWAFAAIMTEWHCTSLVTSGMTSEQAKQAWSDSDQPAIIADKADSCRTTDDVARYIVEEHLQSWRKTPYPLPVVVRIAETLGFRRTEATPPSPENLEQLSDLADQIKASFLRARSLTDAAISLMRTMLKQQRHLDPAKAELEALLQQAHAELIAARKAGLRIEEIWPQGHEASGQLVNAQAALWGALVTGRRISGLLAPQMDSQTEAEIGKNWQNCVTIPTRADRHLSNFWYLLGDALPAMRTGNRL